MRAALFALMVLVVGYADAVAAGESRAVSMSRASFGALMAGAASGTSVAAVEVPGIPLPNGPASLLLERFEVFTNDVWVDVHTPTGRFRGARPTTRFYRGQVIGDPESLAMVSADGDDLRGLIRTRGQVFLLGPGHSEANSVRPASLVLSEVDPVAMPRGPRCAADDLMTQRSLVPPSKRTALTTSTVYNIRVAVETDNELYVKLGGSQSALLSYVGTLFGAASAIYNRDVRANLLVSYVDVWVTSDDPWSSWTTLQSDPALLELGNYWHTNRTAVQRDFAHFLMGKPMGGRAYLASTAANSAGLCSPDIQGTDGNWYGAYSLSGVPLGSFDTTDLSLCGDVDLLCHEIGHICGSPHTHCYHPPVDMCWNGESGCYSGPTSSPAEGGTFMSYCPGGSIRLTLGRPGEPSQAVTDQIRLVIESKATRLTVADPCSLAASPVNATYPMAGGTGSVSITGDAWCPWAATSDASFITFTSNNLGSGPAIVGYRVAPATGASRTGTLTVAGQNVTITQSACATGGPTLCLNSNRFRVTVNWTNPYDGGSAGVGTASNLTSDTGSFWFFSSNNIELVVKVLDGRSTNGKFWVFYGAMSDVAYAITVTDTVTGAVKTYVNPAQHLGSVADTAAFDGP